MRWYTDAYGFTWWRVLRRGDLMYSLTTNYETAVRWMREANKG